MHLLFFFITIFSIAQATNENQEIALWNLFKHVHNKEYINARVEQYR